MVNFILLAILSGVFAFLSGLLAIVWYNLDWNWWWYLAWVTILLGLTVFSYFLVGWVKEWIRLRPKTEETLSQIQLHKIDQEEAQTRILDLLKYEEADYFTGNPEKRTVNVGLPGKEQTEFYVNIGWRYYEYKTKCFFAIDLVEPKRFIVGEYENDEQMIEILNRAAKRRELSDEYETLTSKDQFGNPIQVTKVKRFSREKTEEEKAVEAERQKGVL